MNLPLPMQQAEHLTQASSQHIAISISGPAGANSDPIDYSGSSFRTTAQIQWAAGKLFHSWAEVSLEVRFEIFDKTLCMDIGIFSFIITYFIYFCLLFRLVC